MEGIGIEAGCQLHRIMEVEKLMQFCRGEAASLFYVGSDSKTFRDNLKNAGRLE